MGELFKDPNKKKAEVKAKPRSKDKATIGPHTHKCGMCHNSPDHECPFPAKGKECYLKQGEVDVFICKDHHCAILNTIQQELAKGMTFLVGMLLELGVVKEEQMMKVVEEQKEMLKDQQAQEDEE